MATAGEKLEASGGIPTPPNFNGTWGYLSTRDAVKRRIPAKEASCATIRQGERLPWPPIYALGMVSASTR